MAKLRSRDFMNEQRFNISPSFSLLPSHICTDIFDILEIAVSILHD
jgi:hypothetical protein